MYHSVLVKIRPCLSSVHKPSAVVKIPLDWLYNYSLVLSVLLSVRKFQVAGASVPLERHLSDDHLDLIGMAQSQPGFAVNHLFKRG